ncbi:MAG: hypothetical protein KKH37_03140 [Alphaproteobacteria bacterium]|nr:hypothetical protein [Alphaproteobacteria bacterium]
MNDQAVLFAGPPCSEHRRNILEMVGSHSRKQIETVCRHYVERQAALGISLGEAETLLRFAFLLSRMEGSATLEAFLMHPTTQYWLSAMRRASGEADRKYRGPFARNAGNLGLQLALATGERSSWPIELDGEGGLRLPILGRHVEFGRKNTSARVGAEVVQGGARFRFDDGMTVEIPLSDLVAETDDPEPNLERDGFSLTRYERLMGGCVQLQRRDEWLRPHWTGTNERSTGTEYFGASPDQYPARFPVEPFAEAAAHITRASPELAIDVCSFTPVLVPRSTGPGRRIGFSVSSRQGAMFLDPDEPNLMAENIVHENAHVKLRYMQLVDPILEDFYDADCERFRVPWRPDPRPLPGILEGAYVFSNVLEHRRRSGVEATANDLAKDITGALTILRRHGRFTGPGEQFFSELEAWAAAA